MKQIGLILLLFLAIPIYTHAETVLRAGSDISVEVDQVVEGDYYVSVGPAGKTVMSGEVRGDMYAVGASVIVNGDIGNDLSILAGSAQLHASITDDVRIVAGEVTIAEDVGGDVFVFASSLSILSTAHISGDVFFFGGTLLLEGDVSGSVHGKAQYVNINAHIGTDVDMVASSRMEFGDSTMIDGSVRYTSFATLTRAQGAIITGSVQKNEYTTTSLKEQLRDILVPIFVILFTTLCLYLLAKKELETLVASVEDSFIKNILVGIGVLLFGPIIALLLMLTILGFFVGVITLLLTLLLYVLGIVLSSVVFGAFVLKIFTKRLTVSLVSIIAGMLTLQVCLLIPIIGPFVLFAVFAVTIGALTRRLYHGLF